jgi:hypothetical protein
MYSTCIFCHSPLGANQAVEEFPVGRRLAFDVAKGRLWAVCRACGRWNLSPLEERWEAVEACERAFRGTRVRVSTENVGLARLAEGTELVRIGEPLRPEFAAWRYGDQLGARARRTWMRGIAVGAAGAAAAGAAAAAAPMLLLVVPAALSLAVMLRGVPGSPVAGGADLARLALLRDDGEPLVHHPAEVITRAHIHPAPRRDASWWLEVRTARYDRLRAVHSGERRHPLTGGRAVQAAAVLLAGANARGGSRREVQSAVQRIERAGDPDRYFKEAEREARRSGVGYRELWEMPKEIRLAMEMAAHENAERRAMDGELAELERQWRTAEEIASIADRLAVPGEVERKLERMRGRAGSPSASPRTRS